MAGATAAFRACIHLENPDMVCLCPRHTHFLNISIITFGYISEKKAGKISTLTEGTTQVK
jgi:hypothetical protein